MALFLVADERTRGEDVSFVLSLVGFRNAIEGVLTNSELTQDGVPGETVVFGIDETIARESLANSGNDRGGDRGEVVTGDRGEIERGEWSPFEVLFAGGLGWSPGGELWFVSGRHSCGVGLVGRKGMVMVILMMRETTTGW